MKILSLRIRNFRSFGDKPIEIVFGDGVNLIVGENNVGKSTILKSLGALKGEYNLTHDNYYKGETNRELQIEGEVKLTKAELRSFANSFAKRHRIDKKKVERISNDIGNKIRIAFLSRGGFCLRFGGLHISGGRGEMISHIGIGGSRPIVHWDNILTKYFQPANRVSLFEITKNMLTKENKAGRLDFGFEPPDVIRKLLNTKVKSFSEIRQSPEGTSEHVFESYDGRQVADVLFTLKNGNRLQRAKFEEIKAKFNELFRNLKLEVVKESKESPPRIVIEKKSIEYEVPIDLVGAGIGEMIIFLTHLMASKDMIFGLDMPELHFHPHVQRLLRNIIRKQSEKNQFIVITHSPTFIEPRQIENLVVVREIDAETKVAQLRPGYFEENERLRLFRQLDAGNREFFFSRRVLLVEGPTETGAMPFFSGALSKDFDENGVSMVESGKFFGVFLKLMKGFSFPYIVMCDKDALMNVEKSVTIVEQTIRTSPVLYNLWMSNSLSKSDVKKMVEMESKIAVIRPKPLREIYPDSLFEELRRIASKHGVYVLPSDFEGVLKRDGYGNILRQAKRMSRSKVIRGRYVAEQIVARGHSIPKEFREIIETITEKRVGKPS